eukprot:COSAG05_NODE_3480_length_2034_cov_64.714212_5_plen_63_part_01
MHTDVHSERAVHNRRLLWECVGGAAVVPSAGWAVDGHTLQASHPPTHPRAQAACKLLLPLTLS